MQKTMQQYYSASKEERAEKLHDDICEALAGSGHFKDGRLIVTPVEPIWDIDRHEIMRYGFWVYFDTVEFDNDIHANVLPDSYAAARQK